MNGTVIWQFQQELLEGVSFTIALSVISIVGAVILGAVVASLRLFGGIFWDEITGSYVQVMRNIPIIIQVFFLYDVVGLGAFVSGLIALTLHQSGYIADVVASGFRAVPVEQSETGYSQGLKKVDVVISVLFPQVIRIIFPPLTSQFVEVVKNSAVVMFIGVQELTYQTQEIALRTLHGFEAATAATLLYGVVTLSIIGSMSFVSRRVAQWG